MQLASQSTSIPFMSIKDSAGHNKRTVLFDNKNNLDSKIDKLIAMMGEMTTQSNNQGKPFKPKNYQGKRRGQGRTNCYDRGRK